MSSRNLFKDIITGNLHEANDKLESLLFNKMGYALEEKKKRLDPVGEGDDDIDNDGDSDESDEYLRNRRKKISKAMKEASGMGRNPDIVLNWVPEQRDEIWDAWREKWRQQEEQEERERIRREIEEKEKDRIRRERDRIRRAPKASVQER